MIVYMTLDRETKEPVRTHKNITYRVYNSQRDASIARSAALAGDSVINDQRRQELKEKYPIVEIDTNRLVIPEGV